MYPYITKRNEDGYFEIPVFCKSVAFDGTFYGRIVIMKVFSHQESINTLNYWNENGQSRRKHIQLPIYEYTFLKVFAK